MKISIVIPVYNEAEQLGACLEAIAQQKLSAFEVIVVDNNSSDSSAKIALSYSFVTLLHQKRQGVVHARNLGFDVATGDIIGRIDADTLLPDNWTRKVSEIFEDQSIDAVSGSVAYHDLPFRDFFSKLDLYFRCRIAKGMGKEVFLYGANMALRRELWLASRLDVCNVAGLHEDFDLAIHAQETGATLVFDKNLQADVSLRRFNMGITQYWHYVWLSPKTYAIHGRTSQRHMYTVVWLVIIFYWAIKLAYRSYNPSTAQISVKNLWASTTPIRANPATFVE